MQNNEAPDGWLIWDEHHGKIFIPHPKGIAPNEARSRLEAIGKLVLGPVVFKNWNPEEKK